MVLKYEPLAHRSMRLRFTRVRRRRRRRLRRVCCALLLDLSCSRDSIARRSLPWPAPTGGFSAATVPAAALGHLPAADTPPSAALPPR